MGRELGGVSSSLIWTFDLNSVTRRLAAKGHPQAELLEAEFRKFAQLCLEYPGRPLAPSSAVDDYWHEFVLHTRQYRAFSEKIYGHYMDHAPDDTGGGMQAEFAATVDIYRQQFGEPDGRFWTTPGNSMRPPN